MPQDSMPTLESQLRQMASEEQRRTATELASVVPPLAELGSLGLPPGGLGPIAEAIRTQTSITSVDEARHALLSMPEMSRDEEPEGYLDWFAFGAVVAWVYAADANTTSPSDGVVHTFNRVSELLDEIDNDLGATAAAEPAAACDERPGRNDRVVGHAVPRRTGSRRSASPSLTRSCPYIGCLFH